MKRIGSYKGFKLYQPNEKERKDYGRYEKDTVLIFRPDDEQPQIGYEDWEASSLNEAHNWIDSDISDRAAIKNPRMSMVYDGQVASELTKDDLIKAILRECGCAFEEEHLRAMSEAFRCGFLRGEEYGRADSN